MNVEQLLEARRVAGLIIGFIQHTLTPQQEKELDEWIGESDEHMRLFGDLTDDQKVEESIRWFHDVDQQTALFNVQQAIAVAETERLERSKNRKKQNRVLILYTAAAACVLAVCGTLVVNYYPAPQISAPQVAQATPSAKIKNVGSVLLTTGDGKTVDLQRVATVSLSKDVIARNSEGLLTYPENTLPVMNLLSVPVGKQYTVLLSDGTKVMLNAQSSLQYPSGFAKGGRRVVLQGEGYFEVAKDAQRPFFVQINGTTIEVTGTRFNVHGYTAEPRQIITLLDGGINVKSGSAEKAMKPRQMAVVGKDEISVSIAPVVTESIAWTTGDFSFRDASIETVMQEVSRWYGVEVKYLGVPDDKFSGTINRNSTIQQVLHTLEISARVHFTVSQQLVIVRP